jgi:hypothetical protein
MNRRIVLLSAVGALAVGAACSENHPTLFKPASPNAYGFQLQTSGTNLPRGNARFVIKRTAADVIPESVTVTLQGIDSLATGFYTAWIGDSLGATWKRATGQLTVTRQDTGLDAIGNVFAKPVVVTDLGQQSAVQNGGWKTLYTWSFTRASAGLAVSDSIQTFLISLEATNAATTPSPSRRPLWARRGDGSAVPATGTAFRTASIKFGNWAPLPLTVGNFQPTAQVEYLFSATPARGRGAFLEQTLLVNDSTMARPPIGYYYAVYGAGDFYPPTGSAKTDTIYFGRQKSPWPQREDVPSQYNADSVITDPAVVLTTPPSILAGSFRAEAGDYGRAASFPWKGIKQVWVTLENKYAKEGRMGPARVMGALGNVPYLIFIGQGQ